MSTLTHKRILLGITGGIAAYKSAELVRRLKDQHADVRVVMTRAAQEFITPLTLQALSGNPVHTSLLDPEAEAAMGHIELAKWADLIIVAPATADFIARLNAGMADDLLTTLCLASQAPIALAPAMNQAMYLDKQTLENLKELEAKGIFNLGTDEGSQACGDIGPGRMLDPTVIAEKAAAQFQSDILTGKHVVITAGPTREAIDPVRYISNHSSGKMGYAIAEAALNAGAQVTLISGPVNIAPPERLTVINITSAEEMLEASLASAPKADIFIASAAVADYRAETVAEQKVKKSDDSITLTLVKNPDIVASVAEANPDVFVVGFAAETEKLIEHARGKMERKGLSMIVANDVSNTDIGFNSDQNEVSIIDNQGNIEKIEQCNKTLLAAELIKRISLTITQ